ncbi:MAG: OadG family transporter subunit [Akkermansia sp.]|nr:OadG family transporter subunit [Akkermansia sp.]
MFSVAAFAHTLAYSLMEGLNYQTVGILVVGICLCGLAVIFSMTGSIAAAIQNRAKAKAEAPKAVAAPAATPVPGKAEGMTPEMLAIIAAAVDSSMTELTPELIAVISAAVDAGLDGAGHRIVEIKQTPGAGYAASGRAEIFASHRISTPSTSNF